VDGEGKFPNRSRGWPVEEAVFETFSGSAVRSVEEGEVWDEDSGDEKLAVHQEAERVPGYSNDW